MNSKWIAIGVIIVAILLGGALLFLQTKSSPSNTPKQDETVTQAPVTTSPTQEATEKTENVVEVSLTSDGFSPATITIDKGTKVVWTNSSGDDATVDSDPHPIHTSYTPLNLGRFENGEKLEFVFNQTGTYNIHNHLNPSDRGTIVVK